MSTTTLTDEIPATFNAGAVAAGLDDYWRERVKRIIAKRLAAAGAVTPVLKPYMRLLTTPNGAVEERGEAEG